MLVMPSHKTTFPIVEAFEISIVDALIVVTEYLN